MNFYPSDNDFTQALLVMLVTNIISGLMCLMANLINDYLMPMANLINYLLKVKFPNTIPLSDGIKSQHDSIPSFCINHLNCPLAFLHICVPVFQIFCQQRMWLFLAQSTLSPTCLYLLRPVLKIPAPPAIKKVGKKKRTAVSLQRSQNRAR